MIENKKKKVFELKDEEVEKISGGGGTYRMYHCEDCGHYTIYPLGSTSTYCEQCHVTGPAVIPQNPHGR